MEESNREIIDNTVWSFSTLHMYEQCPYSFYLKKIEKRDDMGNFYAENGSAMHEVFADLLGGKYTLDEAPERYTEKYDLICNIVKPSTMENIYNKCMDYLCRVDPLPDKYEVLMFEEKMRFKVGEYNFVGFADLVLSDMENGEVWLVDHKSADHFLKKDGTPLKKEEDNFNAYKHQMYLYCHALRDYGIFVDQICWHHFKDDGKLTIIPYKEEEYQEALQWAVDVIGQIKHDENFDYRKSYLMCYQLCGYRGDCEYAHMKPEEQED